MADDTYVSNDAWLQRTGRPDLIDEVADQFERAATSGAASFRTHQEAERWPRTSRGWRTAGHVPTRSLERRAG